MASSTNNSGEIIRLISDAKSRFRSVYAVIKVLVNVEVAEESKRRFVDWRFQQPGGSGLGILRTEDERRVHGPDVPQDFYLRYEDSTATYKLWHERPGRWREELYRTTGDLDRCIVFGSDKEPRWVYAPPNTTVYESAGEQIWPSSDPHTDLSFMIDPSEELFHFSLLDDTTLRETGRRALVADRDSVEIEAKTISWGHPPTFFHDFHHPEGTTDHLLLVDAKVGTILRIAARLEDREFYVAEVVEVIYDQDFPKGTFEFE